MCKQFFQACLVGLSVAVPSHALHLQENLVCRPVCPGRTSGIEVPQCDPEPKTGKHCACRVCPDPGLDFSNCSESVEACAGSLKNIQGWFVLESNEAYRMADLLNHGGMKWRSDSIAIMCDPKFRNTLLRDVFKQTSKSKNSNIDFKSLSDDDLEKHIKAHSEGPPGFACLVGLHGPGDIQFADSETQINLLAKLIGEQHRQGKCDEALDTDLVINVRLGDFRSDEDQLVQKVKDMLASDSSIKRIVFSGVLHYGGYEDYNASARMNRRSVQLMERVMKHFEEEGYNTTHRSEPIADKDLCYMASAKNLALGGRRFAKLANEVRKQLSKSSPKVLTNTWIEPVLDAEEPTKYD